MSISFVHFAAIVSTALALAPAAAHAMELPNKIKLSEAEYLVVQKLYRGWQFLGIVVVVALTSTAVLIASENGQSRSFVAALIAFTCLVGTQVVFWAFTFPVNRATENWSKLPSNWIQMRRRWEFSHAASAVLNLIAFVAAVFAGLAL